jgi:hypothetical protein
MRAYCLALSLLAMPIAAVTAEEYRTEVIPLHFLQVSQFPQLLELRTDRQTTLRDALLPRGIVAWGTDTRANALSLTGTEDAVAQTKQVLRLLDIPPRRIRISFRTPRLDEATFKGLGKGLELEGGPTVIHITDAGLQATVKAAPGGPAASLVTSNNVPVRIRTRVDGPFISITPRLNGDNTLALVIPGQDFGQDAGAFTLNRIPSGLPILVSGKGVEGALLIVAEVLPDEEPR